MAEGYRIPAATIRTEMIIKKSRFITTALMASTVTRARERMADLRAEMPRAHHHVYAFRIGFGNSITEGMSDDGEPSGTAGPPTLAVVRGCGIGDILLVTARYFGGTKLGTGGLVRAYTASAQMAIAELNTELKVEKTTLGMDMPYSFYNLVKRLIAAHRGTIVDEVFDADILVIASFVESDAARFADELRERSAGRVSPVSL